MMVCIDGLKACLRCLKQFVRDNIEDESKGRRMESLIENLLGELDEI